MSEIVKLDVGGTIFKTSKSTLTKFNGFFKTMLECDIGLKLDESGCIFIDRSPKHFDLVLNFMRDGDVVLPNCELKLKELLVEAQYYLLEGLIELCNSKIEPVDTPNLFARKLQFIENDSQQIQILANQQKPLLIIGYGYGSDKLFNVCLPGNFNVLSFIDKYSNQFEIYFKRLDECYSEWNAKIVSKTNEDQRSFWLPSAFYFEYENRRSTLLEQLEKLIETYNSR